MNAKAVICVNAYEHGRYELRLVSTGEYWQVYSMKGKTGSWLDNCYNLTDAMYRVHEELKRRLPREFIDCGSS